MLVNILWHPLEYGGPICRTGSIFSCSKGLWDCLPTKPITTKQQSVYWLVIANHGVCGPLRWHLPVDILAAASADPVGGDLPEVT